MVHPQRIQIAGRPQFPRRLQRLATRHQVRLRHVPKLDRFDQIIRRVSTGVLRLKLQRFIDSVHGWPCRVVAGVGLGQKRGQNSLLTFTSNTHAQKWNNCGVFQKATTSSRPVEKAATYCRTWKKIAAMKAKEAQEIHFGDDFQESRSLDCRRTHPVARNRLQQCVTY